MFELNRLLEHGHSFCFDILTQTERMCAFRACSTWLGHFMRTRTLSSFIKCPHWATLLQILPVPPSVACQVRHAWSLLIPLEGDTQMSRGWMPSGCLRETSAASICLISLRGQKWLTQRVPRIPAAGMLRFSVLFFGGSYDSVVHHILMADKQLLKQKASSILKECRKSPCTSRYNDAWHPY